MSTKVTVPKMGGRMEGSMEGRIGGRMRGRTKKARKMNNWAKAAGEYYNDHKNEVESFSDVLKSPKFRAYYNKKYKGKKVGGLDGDYTTSDATIASVINNDDKTDKTDKEESPPIDSPNDIDSDPPISGSDQESQQHLKEQASLEAETPQEPPQEPPEEPPKVISTMNNLNPTGKQPGGKKKAKKSKKRSTKKSRKSKKRFFGLM